MLSEQSALAPVPQDERITILDSIRGFAILGILMMNIPSMSMAGPAAHDPSLLDELGTINYTIWFWVEWFFNGTQRAIFSMLFGAGVYLFTSRLEKKKSGIEPADIFIRRQLWLILFSLVDVFVLLWFGDILLDYALIGIIVFAFRKWTSKKLFIAAGFCLLLMVARENRDLYETKSTISEGEAIALIDTSKTKLTIVQQSALNEMLGMKERWSHAGRLARMKRSIARTNSGYAVLYQYKTGLYTDSLVHYLYFEIWDVILFMLAGLGFFKSGILTGRAPVKYYWWMTLVGLGIGLTLSYWFICGMKKASFSDVEFAKQQKFVVFQLGRTFRAVGILGLLLLLSKLNAFNWLFRLLQPVGQMAFTNYLMQSLITTLLFYGLGWFGQMERHQVYVVLIIIWIIQIIYSNLWLRYFRYGPFEWAWRSLTYWKQQPMRK